MQPGASPPEHNQGASSAAEPEAAERGSPGSAAQPALSAAMSRVVLAAIRARTEELHAGGAPAEAQPEEPAAAGALSALMSQLSLLAANASGEAAGGDGRRPSTRLGRARVGEREGAPAAAGEAAGGATTTLPTARPGVVLSVHARSGHVLVTPEDGSPVICCPLWAVDDAVAMRPGALVEFEVQAPPAPGGGVATQVGTAVRLREEGGSMPLSRLLGQLDDMVARGTRRRLRRHLFAAAQEVGITLPRTVAERLLS